MEVGRAMVVANPVFIHEQWFSGATTPAPTTIRKYSVCVWNCWFLRHISLQFIVRLSVVTNVPGAIVRLEPLIFNVYW